MTPEPDPEVEPELVQEDNGWLHALGAVVALGVYEVLPAAWTLAMETWDALVE